MSANNSSSGPLLYWQPIDDPYIFGLTITGMVALTFGVIFGNALVIIAFFRTRKLRTPSNVYLVSLAFIDLSFGILMLPLNIVNAVNGKWSFDKNTCKFWNTFNAGVATASIYHICLIAFDRYCSVTRGANHIMNQKLKSVLTSIGFVLVLSILIATPPLFNLFPSWLDGFDKPKGSCYVCIDFAYALPVSIVIFIIPAVLLGYWNYKIYVGIRTLIRGPGNITKYEMNTASRPDTAPDTTETESSGMGLDSSNEEEERSQGETGCEEDQGTGKRQKSIRNRLEFFLVNKRKMSMARERRSARILAVIILAFCLCWTPSTVLLLVTPFLQRNQYPSGHVVMMAAWLGYSNSAVNPIIYTVFNPEFRVAFQRILTCARIRRKFSK